MWESAAYAAAGLSAVSGLTAGGSGIRGREKRRAAISFVIVANTKRVFCAKFLRRVIGEPGVEKQPNEKT